MLVFDGHAFDGLLIYGDPTITLFSANPSYIDSNSRDGRAVNGIRYDGWTVEFSIVVDGDALTRRDKLSTLGSWLDVDEPKKLILPDTPDRYYLAVPEGELQLTRGMKAEYGRLAFTVIEPTAYGEEHSVIVPSGGSATFHVGGTAATKPSIAANATRDASSLVWGLRLDDGDFVHVATGSSSAKPVSIDCDERTSTVDGSVSLPTLDSDWLVLTPGEHTLTMDNGTGAATVTWRERWY